MSSDLDIKLMLPLNLNEILDKSVDILSHLLDTNIQMSLKTFEMLKGEKIDVTNDRILVGSERTFLIQHDQYKAAICLNIINDPSNDEKMTGTNPRFLCSIIVGSYKNTYRVCFCCKFGDFDC